MTITRLEVCTHFPDPKSKGAAEIAYKAYQGLGRRNICTGYNFGLEQQKGPLSAHNILRHFTCALFRIWCGIHKKFIGSQSLLVTNSINNCCLFRLSN